jgi:hypothetical protein
MPNIGHADKLHWPVRKLDRLCVDQEVQPRDVDVDASEQSLGGERRINHPPRCPPRVALFHHLSSPRVERGLSTFGTRIL